MNNSIVDTLVEIKLEHEDDFVIIMETLTRIGIASKESKKLTQTCHILHKQGKYYIVHFLEMFMLDGKQTHFTEEDCARRNTIISLLEQWELLTVIDKESIKEPRASMRRIMVIKAEDKKFKTDEYGNQIIQNPEGWELISKYKIGGK